MTRVRGQWGGPRRGAGRPSGTRAPVDNLRRNRLMISLTDGELAKLEQIAEDRNLPPATVAYQFVAKALKRRK